MGSSFAKAGDKEYWSLTPANMSYRDAIVHLTSTAGGPRTRAVGDSGGVRPVISLRADVKVISGDGSYERPYKIDTTS